MSIDPCWLGGQGVYLRREVERRLPRDVDAFRRVAALGGAGAGVAAEPSPPHEVDRCLVVCATEAEANTIRQPKMRCDGETKKRKEDKIDRLIRRPKKKNSKKEKTQLEKTKERDTGKKRLGNLS